MLYISALCPYARRTVYANSFKSANLPITLVDQDQKPEWFLEMNPNGTVPVLKISKFEKEFFITESLQIIEYLNSFPGQNLYPTINNRVIPAAKAVVDIQISTVLEPLLFYLMKYIKTRNLRSLNTVKEILVDLNEKYLIFGNFVTGIIGYENVTNADLVLYPIIDYLFTEPCDLLADILPLVRGNYIENWYRRISLMDWAIEGKKKIQEYSCFPKL